MEKDTVPLMDVFVEFFLQYCNSQGSQFTQMLLLFLDLASSIVDDKFLPGTFCCHIGDH